MNNKISNIDKLRNILSDNKLYVMPCCYDALSAKMIEKNIFRPLPILKKTANSGGDVNVIEEEE